MSGKATAPSRMPSPVPSQSSIPEIADPLATQSEDEADDEDLLGDPQGPDEPGYRYGSHKFQFKGLGKLIDDTFKHTNGEASDRAATRAEHNQKQREIWQSIREAAASDTDIPNALFDPPRTFIQIQVHYWPREGHYCCPCDIEDEHWFEIDIRAPAGSAEGITKDMFLEQVCEAYHGAETYTVSGEDQRPVLDHFTYMMQGLKDEVVIQGHIFAMTRGIVNTDNHDDGLVIESLGLDDDTFAAKL